MKKIVRLTESDIESLVKKIIDEGKIGNSVKEKDLDVKMENFRDKTKDFVAGFKDCKVQKDGNDFKILRNNKHIAQVMFRKDYITVKKVGDKFGEEFDLNKFGSVKSKLNKICGENINEGKDGYESSRYMFFSNLEQMKRQAEILLELDEDQVHQILDNGHDWAQDHISESKNNMDQVFDFLMNEINDTKTNVEGHAPYYDDEDNTDVFPNGTSDW